MKNYRKLLHIVVTVMLMLSALLPQLVGLAEEMESVEADLDEVVSTEEEVSELIEKVNSDDAEIIIDETLIQTEQEDELIESSYLEIITTVDDNTLFIHGIANPNVFIGLRNSSGSVQVQSKSNHDGSFVLELNDSLEAGQSIDIWSYTEIENLETVTVVVENVGLSLNDGISEKSGGVVGRTTANREVQLIDELGNIVNVGQSDGYGNFHVGRQLSFEEGEIFSVQVLDQQKVAKIVNFEVQALDKDEVIESVAISPFALIDIGLIRISADAIKLENSIITESTKILNGHVEINEALISVELLGIEIDLLSLVVDLLVLLSDKNINLKIHTDGQIVHEATTRLSSTEALTFSFDISDVDLIPGRSTMTLQPEGLVLSLNILLSLPVEFDPKTFYVEGDRLEITSVPAVVQFESADIKTRDEVILPRIGEDPLVVTVVDTETLSNPESDEWRLTVNASQPLSMGEFRILGSLYFNEALIEGSQNAQVVATRNDFEDLGGSNYSYTLPSTQDFYLKLTPFTDATEGDYHTTIEWNLINAY